MGSRNENNALFRSEALTHHKDRLYGDVLLLQPFSYFIMTVCAVTLTVLMVVFLAWGAYAKKERVPGFVVPDKGIVKVYGAHQQGTITKTHIVQGSLVSEGDMLFTILSDKSQKGSAGVEQKILDELQATRDKYQLQIESEAHMSQSQMQRLVNQKQNAASELTEIQAAMKIGQERIVLSKQRADNAERLKNKGHLAQVDHQKIYEEYLTLMQQQNELVRAEVNKKNNLMELTSEIEQLPILQANRMHELEKAMSEINQRYTEIAGRREFVIRAPVAGRVSSISAHEGDWLSTTPLLSIIPKDAKLQIVLYVPSRAIGFIEEGQEVRLRYDAFPYQRFGIHQGKVVRISKNILTPQELPIPLDLPDPVYQVTAEIKVPQVEAYGKVFPLQAGMHCEADIILDKHNIFMWMIEPILSLRGHL